MKWRTAPDKKKKGKEDIVINHVCLHFVPPPFYFSPSTITELFPSSTISGRHETSKQNMVKASRRFVPLNTQLCCGMLCSHRPAGTSALLDLGFCLSLPDILYHIDGNQSWLWLMLLD
jgi:hypothetical protein